MRFPLPIVFAVFLPGAAAIAAPAQGLRIVLTAPPTAADCTAAGLKTWTASVPLGDPLLEDGDIDAFREDAQAFVLTAAATTRMFANAAAFGSASDEVAPAGAFFSADGRGFVLLLGDTRLTGGMVAALLTMAEPAACPRLYPVPPMPDRGRLVIALGTVRSRDELGEDASKVLVEEGPAAVFASKVPAQAIAYLRKGGRVGSRR